MTPFIFFYGASVFLAGVVCLILGMYVLAESRNPLNVLYFLLTVALFGVGVFEALLRVSPSVSAAYVWGILATFAWLLVFSFFLHFSLVFSGVKFRNAPLIYFLSEIMFLYYVFAPYYVSGIERKPFGYSYFVEGSDISYVLFYLIYMGAGLYFIWRVYRGGKEFYRRKQAQLILFASLIPLAAGTVFDELLFFLKRPTLPIALHAIALTIGIMGYAILRYSPVSAVTKEQIAEAAAAMLVEPLFLTDEKGIINYANLAAEDLTGFRTDELLGENIEMVVLGKGEKISGIKKKDKSFAVVDLKVFPITGERGFIYLARDLSPILRSRKIIHKMTSELNQLIRRERATIRFLFEFSELNEPKKVEELWGRVCLEGIEVQTTLQPVYVLVKEYAELFGETRKARDELAEKTAEIDTLNKLMAGREEILIKLEKEYEELSK
ncbi:PAS domain-containing protein [Candidatus Saganbacteria bacterium]|uniref:PAS domain-containing protein n=1 Tax=Candidatus Saganbacteria bacterium TaxID=2575572 RepID=A0A9D6UK86_UNCSA|nr:PAS domain-containing protein [Candidatus Saganbacteria bacterium]